MTTAIALTALQNATLHHVLTQCPVHASAELREFALMGGNHQYVIAAARIRDTECDAERLVLNLPDTTPHAFVTVTDADFSRMGRLLANMEKYERYGTPICEYDYIELADDEFLIQNGRVGAMMVPAEYSSSLHRLGEIFDFHGQQVHFLMPVFLSPSENDLRLRSGTDALLASWNKVGRDLVTFAASC
jgi:hypothetical protein